MDRYERDLSLIIKRCGAISNGASSGGRNKDGTFRGGWDDKCLHCDKLFGKIHELCDERDSQPTGEKRTTEDIMRDQTIMKQLLEAAELLEKMDTSHKNAMKKVNGIYVYSVLIGISHNFVVLSMHNHHNIHSLMHI